MNSQSIFSHEDELHNIQAGLLTLKQFPDFLPVSESDAVDKLPVFFITVAGTVPDLYRIPVLMPKIWQPKYFFKKNYTNLTKNMPTNKFHFKNCLTAFSCVSVFSNKNSSLSGL